MSSSTQIGKGILLLFFCLGVFLPGSPSLAEPKGGIGVILEYIPDKKVHRIRAVFQNSPAARAQIKAGDEVVSIDGQSTAAMSFEDLGNKIRGDPGTSMSLVLKSPSTGTTREVRLTRAGQQSVSPLITDAPGTPSPGRTLRPSFTEEETQKVKAVILQLKTPEEKKKMEGLLIELRDGKIIKSDFWKILQVTFPQYVKS